MSRFAREVKKRGGYKAVAKLLGCSYEFVRTISTGEKTPGLAMAFKIEELLKIPVSYWKDGTAKGDDSKAAG